MLKLPDQFNLNASIRRTSVPVMLSLLTGCATTVQKFDPDYCMEWSETNAKALVFEINSRSKTVYQNACVQGRAGAQVTLIANNGNHLHPVSATIGKKFLTIVKSNTEQEKKDRAEEEKTVGDNDILNAPKVDEGMTFSEKIRYYFNYYIGMAGFTEQDIDRDAKLPPPQAEAKRPVTPELPQGCTKNADGKGFDCH